MERTLASSSSSITFLLLALVGVGCSASAGKDGNSCSVEAGDASGTATIVCTDGTKTVVEGGTQGSSCSVSMNGDGTKTIKCDDGTKVTVSDGDTGAKGEPGAKGATGATGDRGDTGTKGEPGAKGATGDAGVDGIDGVDGTGGQSAYVVGAGLKIDVTAVSIPADLHPVVSVRMRDTANHPLDRAGVYTPGAVSASFVLSYLSSNGGSVGEYVPYNTGSVNGVTVNAVPPVLASATQPKSESNGTWTVVDSTQGTYTYRFANALPGGYDQTKTHTLAIYASRTFDGAQYASNPLFHFRPDGAAVTEKREIVTTETCNGCHDTLAVHGGSRREVGLCITCHVSGMNDPESGNTLDLAQMVHKIHSGRSLPSVAKTFKPYRIIGFNGSVNDYSTVGFPQPLENCTSCHQGGADSARWKTGFSRAACGSCHDDISFINPPASGLKLHTGGQQTTDTLCVNCHAEGMGPIASLATDVTKVHHIQQDFDLRDATSGAFISSAPVLTGAIVSVTNVGAGLAPVVTFNVAVNGAPYDILASGKALDRIRFTFAGPTTDYVNAAQLTAQGSGVTGTLVAGSTAGEFVWTSASTLTQIAGSVTPTIPLSGTWAVGMEGRLKGPASKPDNSRITVTYFMHNDVAYFPVTDATAVPRRTAVVVANCNHCHEDLQAHGGSRNDPEYCVLCHNANKDALDVPAPAAGMTKLTGNLRLSHMIHRIHTGEDGATPYVIGSNDFSEVRFPGDRRDCTHCHVPDHYKLPLPALLPTHLTQMDSTSTRVPNTDTYMGATAAACTGCHDSTSTQVHTATMSLASPTDPADIQEACATCHAAGQTYGLDIVHARPGL